MNLKIPGTDFLLITFSNIKKKHTYESQNNWHSFLAYLLFQILKKHTYESPNTAFHTNNNFKENNLYKNHYTNNSHKKQLYKSISIK